MYAVAAGFPAWLQSTFRGDVFFVTLAAALGTLLALVIVYFVVGTFVSRSSPNYYGG
jgi:hypothetical protein